MHSRIIGTGSYVPKKIISNSDLYQFTGKSDSWILERTGIRERHAAAEGETTSEMAYRAAFQALQNADLAPERLDMIVVGTVTGDYSSPATAALVQARLGAKKAFAFDVSASSAGGLYALAIADQFVCNRAVERALVIGADLLTRYIDWNDRNTCVLFGDAAGALVMAPCSENRGLLSCHLHSDGTWSGILGIDNRLSPRITMNGREVYRVAVRTLVAAAKEALSAQNVSAEQITHVIGHQANLRIIEAVMERLGIPMDRFCLTLDRYGNTSAASIPMCFDEAHRQGRLKEDDLILVLAAGAGFVWGSALMRW